MSLTTAQRDTTRTELAANLAASGLTAHDLAERLALTPRQVATALDVTGRPHDVWLVRDYLEGAAGRDAVPYTVLVESARAAASSWFPLRRAPSC